MWLETGMRRQLALRLAGRTRRDHVTERPGLARPAETARFPFPQIVLNPAFNRSTIHQPWFPHGTRHYAYFGKLCMCCFGTVTASHRHGQPNEFAAPFQACLAQRIRDHVRNKRIGRDDNMGARHELWRQKSCPHEEERSKVFKLPRRKRCEPRYRRPYVSIIGRWNPPHAAFPIAKLGLLFCAIFVQPVGRIRHNGVNTVAVPLLDPVEAISMKQCGVVEMEGGAPRLRLGELSLNTRHAASSNAV